MRGGKRGQVAMEYLIIVGLTVAMTLPLMVIFITQSTYLEADVAQAQLEKASYLLSSTAKQIYYAGPPSQKTIEVTFPAGITGVTLANESIQFSVWTTENPYTYYQDVGFALNGSISAHEGLHVIEVKAVGSGVQFTER